MTLIIITFRVARPQDTGYYLLGRSSLSSTNGQKQVLEFRVSLYEQVNVYLYDLSIHRIKHLQSIQRTFGWGARTRGQRPSSFRKI